MRRSLRLSVLVCTLAAATQVHVHATSVQSVSFDDLIAQSDVVFVGQVVDVRPFTLQTSQGTIVKTRVTFRVDDALSGGSSAVEVFDFLGGEADGIGLKISGMPAFTVGDRRVVFARRDQSINPIVGFTQGLMKVTRDGSGVDRVRTLEGAPVAQLETLGTPMTAARAAMTPMRLADFRDRVKQAWAKR